MPQMLGNDYGSQDVQKKTLGDMLLQDPKGYQSNRILGEQDEEQFQSWIRETPWFKQFFQEYREEPYLNTPEYDYRGAWQAGVEPQINKHDNRYHWDGRFKSETHPTKWKQDFWEKYGFDPDDKGVTQEQFMNM